MPKEAKKGHYICKHNKRPLIAPPPLQSHRASEPSSSQCWCGQRPSQSSSSRSLRRVSGECVTRPLLAVTLGAGILDTTPAVEGATLAASARLHGRGLVSGLIAMSGSSVGCWGRGRRELGSHWGVGCFFQQVRWGLGILALGLGHCAILNISKGLLIIVHSVGSLFRVDREKQSGLDRRASQTAARKRGIIRQYTAGFICSLAIVTGNLVDIGELAELLLAAAVIKKLANCTVGGTALIDVKKM